jgi:hypothetical protein
MRVDLVDFDGHRDGLLCGGCRKPVTYNRGVDGRRSPHFVHKADGSGGCGLMTAAHRIFRDATVKLIQGAGGLPPWLVWPAPFLGPHDAISGRADAEKTIPGTAYRADVLFTGAERLVVLEVVVTKGVEPEKRDATHAIGGAIAALRVDRDPERFLACADELAEFTIAVDEIRRLGGFKLLSPRLKVVPAPSRRVITTASPWARFHCNLRSTGTPVSSGGAYRRAEYTQPAAGYARPDRPPAVPRPRRQPVLGPTGDDEADRILAYWEQINAGKEAEAAARCCDAAVINHRFGRRFSWVCDDHNDGGWL